MTESKDIGILGGGVAGLSLAYFLGEQAEVLEKSTRAGGLCRSFEKDGFTFDLGGHILFSKDQEILNLELSLLQGKLNKLHRSAACWFKNRFVKYPFENGLAALDKEDAYECLLHFVSNSRRPQHNFEDWIYNTFGKGLAEMYLLPYNKKIWKTPPSEMDFEWVERIPKPPIEDIVKSAMGIETEGYVHQLHFYYPKEGGFETLPQTLEANINGRITKDFPVERISKTSTGWIVSNGSADRRYRKLICAMPVFDLIKCLPDVPSEVRHACENLVYNSLCVVLIGLNRPRKHDLVSCFFPQSDIIFHRLVFHDYFGTNYVPAGCSSMVCEITSKYGDEIWSMPEEKLIARVVDDLRREGFIEKPEVVTTAVQRTRYAYPVYDLGRSKNLQIIKQFCKQMEIDLCGRFAEFQYDNSDQVIRSAKTVSERVLNEVGLH
ncbi:MAG: FAD-dependent oxidoreductase [Cyanobacteria bacterium DS2.3.42]|nr:FAD-dependent oxidoreductase [Cyanobacteria bacterium DS2.3.42]